MATNTLQEWFETPLGQYLLEKERAYLDEVTPDIFGFHALQVGMPEVDLLRENRITHKLRVAGEGEHYGAGARTGKAAALPTSSAVFTFYCKVYHIRGGWHA